MTTATTCTIREAEARFPAIVERVRDGETATVADEGQPAVEMRLAPGTMREKLRELERDGILVRPRSDTELGRSGSGYPERWTASWPTASRAARRRKTSGRERGRSGVGATAASAETGIGAEAASPRSRRGDGTPAASCCREVGEDR